jgi:outer membrane receptor protein involved in Fe transport
VDERAGQEVVYDGNRMEAAPAFLANGEVAYSPAYLPGARLAVEGERVSGYFMDPENTTRYGGHFVVNVRGSYEFQGALRGFELWASLLNAADVLYATNASISFGQAQYTPGLPRSVTLGLAYRFGR